MSVFFPNIVFLALLTIIIFPSKSHSNTKVHMGQIYDKYYQLHTHLNLEADNHEELTKKYLQDLETALIRSKKDKMLDSPLFAPNRNLIIRTIKEIRVSSHKSTNQYLKYRIKNLFNTCTACHEQLPAELFKPLTKKFQKLKVQQDYYEKLTFVKFFRDYEAALTIAKEEFTSRSKQKNQDLMISSLNDTLVLYLAHLNRPEDLTKYLEKMSVKFKDLKDVHLWINKNLHDLANIKKVSFKAGNDKKLLKLIKKYLQPQETTLQMAVSDKNTNIVTLHRMRHELFRYSLRYPQNNIAPALLYWRGLIENQKNTFSFYSLGDAYLEECILIGPKSSYAQKCLAALKVSTTNAFTGSSGTNIPEVLKLKLQNLEKKIRTSK